ncbi:hypothetical protein ACN4EE_06865 [Geminocystis sp. CENA526]|uniref:hypothetical protein n=1 Tax=Geminocystis sp. CENA526 TaxID=1355871 RepID=UPI003D6ED325
MFNQLGKILTILLLTFCLIFTNGFVYVQTANAKVINEQKISNNSNYDWNKIDKLLVQKIKDIGDKTEQFAEEELNNYVDELMIDVDHKFLDWYFGFFQQKLMEYKSIIDWIAFKLDEPLKVLRKEDEKNLNSKKIIEKRLTEDFYNKFQELVLNKSAQKDFKNIIETTGKIYRNSMSLVFADIKNYYKIPDEDWNNHLGDLATLIYDTGNSQSSLSVESLSSYSLTEMFILGSATIGAKLFSNIAIKASSKVAVKSGASIALSTTAELVNPLVAIGFVIWEVWDYRKIVEKSRTPLRQNILDYLKELKNRTLYDSNVGIIPALEEIEAQVIEQLLSHS